MKADDLSSLRGLPGDPDQSPPGFRRRFVIRVRRSLAVMRG